MGRIKLTAGRVRDFTCETGKPQSFLWDTDAPGLAVRATAAGAKSYVFQGKLNGGSIRITIGSIDTWGIEGISKDPEGKVITYGAREEARRLQALIDQGIDPRHARAEEIAAAEARQAEFEKAREGEARQHTTVRKAWDAYIDVRKTRPRKGKVWSLRHQADHQNVASEGGEGKRVEDKKAGALAALMPLKLADLTQARVQKWLEWESSTRPTQAALAYRLLRAFLNWCEEEPDFAGLAATDACTAKKTRESLRKTSPKTDCLQREQLLAWFAKVRALSNPIISAYLQGLLLTGARREELAGLRWADVDFRWNSMTIRDKVEGERTIPLTPYVHSLFADLKARNDKRPDVKNLKGETVPDKDWKPSPWVFSSRKAATGRLQEPAIGHRRACAAAGIPGMTLHGLRRSFKSLAEWVEMPVGIVAQIMGHKPSATAEKHYTVRPLDLLRLWHTRYEAWILEEAGIEQPKPETEVSRVRRVQ